MSRWDNDRRDDRLDQSTYGMRDREDEYGSYDRMGERDEWRSPRREDDTRDNRRETSGRFGEDSRREYSRDQGRGYRGADTRYDAGQGGDSERDNRGWRDDRYLGQARERAMSGRGEGESRYAGHYGGGRQEYGGSGVASQRPNQNWQGDRGETRGREGDLAMRGRQGQHTGKGPKGYQRSDERILEEANDCLTRDGDIDATNVEVQVTNGEITLSGTVEDRQQKRAAEDALERLQGVKEIHNQIRVHRNEQHQETARAMTGSKTAGTRKTAAKEMPADEENGHGRNGKPGHA
jgi:osmotically-inducible protein OsmY